MTRLLYERPPWLLVEHQQQEELNQTTSQRLRPFQFDLYPPHVGYRSTRATNAFRAAILAELAQETTKQRLQLQPKQLHVNRGDNHDNKSKSEVPSLPSILWLEPDVRLNSLSHVVNYIRTNGFLASTPLCSPDGCTSSSSSSSCRRLKDSVHPAMAPYFGTLGGMTVARD